MKTKTYLWGITIVALIALCGKVYAQEKNQQKVARVKIIENNQVVIDTSIKNSSPELEKELQELLKERDMVILRAGKSDVESPTWHERDILVIRRDVIDSIMIQLQQKMQEVKIQITDNEEFRKLKEEMRMSWEKSKQELDSMRIRILKKFDTFSPPEVYFFKDDKPSREVVVIKKSKDDDTEAAEERVFERVIRRDVNEKKQGTGESKVIVMQKGEGEIIEIDGIKIIIPAKESMKIEKPDEDYYKIETKEGRTVIISIKEKNKVETNPSGTEKRKTRK